MGSVFRAWDLQIERQVAVKVLGQRVANDQVMVRRLQLEARSLSALKHKNILQVFAFGFDQTGIAYMVTELLEGRTLAQELAAGSPLPVGQAVEIFVQISEGLNAAHGWGVIHRDIKPSNIFLAKPSNDGEPLLVKLLDFGIAKVFNGTSSASGSTLVGTPAYMSPEHYSAGSLDARSDIYSLGCLMYEVIAGVPLFDGDSLFEIVNKHQEHEPALLRQVRTDTPPSLERMVARCLAKKPDDRYQSVAELLCDLRQLQSALRGECSEPRIEMSSHMVHSSRKRRRRVALLSLLGVLGLVALLAIYLVSSPLRTAVSEKPDADQPNTSMPVTVYGAVQEALRQASRNSDRRELAEPYWQNALRLARQMGANDEELAEIHLGLSRSMISARKFAAAYRHGLQAEKISRQRASSRPDLQWCRSLLAVSRAAGMGGRHQESYDYAKAAEKAFPSSAQSTKESRRVKEHIMHELVRACRDTQRFHEALEYADSLMVGGISPWPAGEKIDIYASMGDWQSAVAYAEKALSEKTEEDIAWDSLECSYAEALQKVGRFQDSAKVCQRVIDNCKNPDLVIKARIALAQVLEHQERYDEAVKMLEKAWEEQKDPAARNRRQASIMGHLSRIYAKLGDTSSSASCKAQAADWIKRLDSERIPQKPEND